MEPFGLSLLHIITHFKNLRIMTATTFSPASIVSSVRLFSFFDQWWKNRARNIGGSVSGLMTEEAISTFDSNVADRDMSEFIEYVYEQSVDWCELHDIDE